MPLSDWELSYRDFTFGGDTDVAVVAIDGLAGLPDIRTADTALLRRHGLHAGDDFLAGRTVLVELEVFADDDTALAATWSAVQTAFRPADIEQPLTFRIPGIAGGTDARLNCRPRRLSAPVTLDWYRGLFRCTIEFAATDPRVYSADEQGQTVDLATAAGGLTFNATAPITFGAVSSGGVISATNAGNFDAPVVLRIDGPALNPRIENVQAGRTIAVDIDILAGEFLLIDTGSRTVLAGGTASRYSNLAASSEWWDLAPGLNEIRWSAATPSSATLTATWRSAWA